MGIDRRGVCCPANSVLGLHPDLEPVARDVDVLVGCLVPPAYHVHSSECGGCLWPTVPENDTARGSSRRREAASSTTASGIADARCRQLTLVVGMFNRARGGRRSSRR